MKIINVSADQLYLQDIDFLVPYHSDKRITEIPDVLARRSRTLAIALHSVRLVDVTNGVPTPLPEYRPKTIAPDPESPYFARQAALSKDNHGIRPPENIGTVSPFASQKIAYAKLPSALDMVASGTIPVAWTGPACFLPSAKVVTALGVKPISEIKEGDLVFTHKGCLRKVIRTYRRQYNGEMLAIRTALDSEETILTPYHKTVCIKGTPCSLRKTQICKPSCLTQSNLIYRNYGRGVYLNCAYPPHQEYVLQKIPAGELSLNDFLVLPKLKVPETVTSIVISEYLGNYRNYSTDDKWIWPSPSFQTTCLSTLAKINGIKPASIYQIEKLSPKNRKKITKIIGDASSRDPLWNKDCGNRIPTKIELNYDFGRFIGLYLAEGSATNGSFNFALHRKEKNTAMFLRKFLSKMGLGSAIYLDKRSKGMTVSGCSVLLATMLKEICGHDCYSKRIPAFAFSAPMFFIDGLIRGFWEGDGKRTPRKKDNSLKLCTISPSLAYGLRLLFSKFDIEVGLTLVPEQEKIFNKKKYMCHPQYLIIISGQQLYTNKWLLSLAYNARPHKLAHSPRQRLYYSDQDYTYLKITEIRKLAYTGEVFDLEIDEDHTYLVNGKGFSNSDAGGFARMNRKFMFGLSDADCLVRYDKLDSINDMDRETNAKMAKLMAARIPDDALKVYGMTSPMHYDWARYKFLFTMMETRCLHPDYVIRTNCADEVVVPSKWCYDMFKESGVKRPMYVVPLGVDTDIYHPGAEPLEFTKNLKPFIFLSVFGWSLRKGYDVLLKAYLSEFTSDDPVTLLIASRYFGSTDESKKQVIRNDVARISSTVANPKKPQVVLFGDVLSDVMMPRLYAAAKCYVLISRGEGYGLPMAEAGACNLPVICTRYSGQTDFLDDNNSYLVDVDGFTKADPELAKVSYFYENAEFPKFGDAAVAQTRALMRRVYENKEEAQQKANKLYQRIVGEYTWPNCVRLMHDKLQQSYDFIKATKTKGNANDKVNFIR